ncbi:hypothetical protein FB45DRAFT_988060 [Roridomyces roridus]|uniref:CBF1-interacting co-repressor CIR N-terminal domain-containing protein n=1 Tax=Roridomyces roridus TaxID=1738132 RepID=A0AAD7C7A3_9AGAR|nr:hypothetical protein FB45DRAFT_988060 [Roridomyces roridus]
MGKLNIAHHKSYHPYRRDNIEKVRRDEEEARLKESKEEGRMMLADSEARIDRLRERAGSKPSGSKKRKDDDDMKALAAAGGSMQPAVLPTTGGHINFFEDLEQSTIATAIRTASASKGKNQTDPVETDRGFPLAPSARDLKPWYTERGTKESASTEEEEVEDEKRRRDTMRKSTYHDPLTSITHQLAVRARQGQGSSSSSSSTYRPRTSMPPPSSSSSSRPPEVQARLTRESSERERAQELIRRKQREMRRSETPSTVHGGYEDVFNRREVEEAHRGRDGRGDWRRRGW